MKKTKEQISFNMSMVKSKDSIIERKLGRALWKEGFRYRKNYSKLEGKPDFVLVKYKVAIFCDSKFWHGYHWSEKSHQMFKSNQDFWIKKIERNISRDKEVNKILKKKGWKVARFWEHDISKNIDKTVEKVKLLAK